MHRALWTALGLVLLVMIGGDAAGSQQNEAQPLASPAPAPSGGTGSWIRARASWYGTPDWVNPFVATRGGGKSAFGIIEWGGCGYTNGDGTLAGFSKEEATSYSDDNPDWAGSCGRCYEVKCVNGPVLGTGEKPIPLEYLYYYPKFAKVPDEQGRSFPGNPSEAQNFYTVSCWDPSKSTVVKVVDLCPCWYCPTGQACRWQESCCYKRISHPKAGQISLDLSFWAFQKLAHPEYGIMMIDYRPVDCYSHQPVSYIPGYISKTIYTDAPQTGWAFFIYNAPPGMKNDYKVIAGGEGVQGSAAACGNVDNGGAMTFWSRGAGVPGFQPFQGVGTVSFWIKDKNNVGKPPPVKVVLSGDPSLPTNAPPGTDKVTITNCNNQIYLSNRGTSQTGSGGWLKYDIPFSDFGCSNPGGLNKIDFYTTARSNFCVDELKLL